VLFPALKTFLDNPLRVDKVTTKTGWHCHFFGASVSQSVNCWQVELLDGASVLMRLCDARRADELPSPVFSDHKVQYLQQN